MPWMQVELPDDLYRAVKDRKLPASEMLQAAVRAELDRERILDDADRYLEELRAEVGEPTDEDRAWAKGIVDDILRR